MNESPSKLPLPVLVAFVVLLILAVVVTFLRQGGTAERGPSRAGPAADPARNEAELPARAALMETRREGTAYDCTAVGRVHGIMKQSTELAVYHPIFRGDIRSRWLAPWTSRFSAEVLRNDGRTIHERRTFHEVRSVELIAEPELCDLSYELDPRVGRAITELAAKLRMIQPGNLVSEAMGALIKSQHFDYSEIARLTGIDQQILASQRSAVSATARILDRLEGRTIEVSLRDGRAEWIYAPDLPERLVDTLSRIHSLVDYTALPPPELAVGEQVTLSDIVINELMPPPLAEDFLGNFDTELTLDLTRTEDQVEDDGRVLQCFRGDGRLGLVRLDGNAEGRLDLDRALLYVDVTDPTNRYLHRLELSMPMASHVLQTHGRFRQIEWDGDLVIDVAYTVELQP